MDIGGRLRLSPSKSGDMAPGPLVCLRARHFLSWRVRGCHESTGTRERPIHRLEHCLPRASDEKGDLRQVERPTLPNPPFDRSIYPHVAHRHANRMFAKQCEDDACSPRWRLQPSAAYGWIRFHNRQEGRIEHRFAAGRFAPILILLSRLALLADDIRGRVPDSPGLWVVLADCAMHVGSRSRIPQETFIRAEPKRGWSAARDTLCRAHYSVSTPTNSGLTRSRATTYWRSARQSRSMHRLK